MSALGVQQKAGISYKGQYTTSKLINVCKKFNHVWLVLTWKQKHNLSTFLHVLKAMVHAKKFNPLSIILLFPVEKIILSESGEKYAQIKHYLQVKTVQNCGSDLMCEDNRDGLFHWMMHYYGLSTRILARSYISVSCTHPAFLFTRR